MRKTTMLRGLLGSPALEHLMEAHDGLSGRIAEESGFKALWGSGLCISASLGLTDNNVASFSEILAVARQIAEATTVPLLLDGDAGYGGILQVRRFARLVESTGIAGLCLEDNPHPKRNSLLDGPRPRVLSAEAFCAKLRAARDAVDDRDFVIVARTEAFIAGLGLEEALRRAALYIHSGADAILVHSARQDASEVLEFARYWEHRAPLVIVPTKYANTPTAMFEDAGISMCIWANHSLRAAVKAMQSVTRELFLSHTAASLGTHLVPVEELFRLQRQSEMDSLERYYTENAQLAEDGDP